MRILIAITAALLTVDVGVPARAQVQPPLDVGAFGGRNESLPQLSVPSSLRQFIPRGAFLRAILKTQMALEGETCLLYDNGDNDSLELHLDAIQHGKATTLFNGAVSGFAGLVPFNIEPKRQALGFAYHVGFDCSDTTFVVYAASQGSYERIFELQTTEGKMEIVESPRVRLTIWSADGEFDPPDASCIWCPHRYHVQSYSWRRGKFKVIHESLTWEFLNPSEIAGKPFILLPAQPSAAHSSRP